MLPMFPRRPILLGGIDRAAALDRPAPRHARHRQPDCSTQRIDWFWFIASQIAFGVVAGLVVVAAAARCATLQNVPFAVRAGIEAPGSLRRDATGEERSR